MKLRDPEVCPDAACGGKTHVINKRNRDGKIWRRHLCEGCGLRWTSWQSLANPDLIDPRDLDRGLLDVNQ